MPDYTTAQLLALKSALASGALEVQFENRTVRYRSLAEIKELIAMMEGELGTSASTGQIRHVRMAASKGT